MDASDTELITERLRARLVADLCVEDVHIRNVTRSGTGYSRENWSFDASWRQDGVVVERRLFLRRDPVGSVLETDRANEVAVLRALEDNGALPTPRVVWCDLTGEALDRPSLITERLEGVNDRGILNNEAYPLEVRLSLVRQFTELLAGLHALNWERLAVPFDGGILDTPKGVALAQVDYWADYMARQAMEPDPLSAEVVSWLRRHAPENTRVALVHGDYRPGNMLIRDGRVSAVLDWEMAHLGDPLEDIGWWTMPTRYETEHFIRGAWEYEDFLDYYEACSGSPIDMDALQFYRVLGVWKMEAILRTGFKAICERRTDQALVGTMSLARLLAEMIEL